MNERDNKGVQRLSDLLASEGPAEPNSGLVERVMDALPTQRPIAAEPSRVEAWIPLAWPTALIATAAAVALWLFVPSIEPVEIDEPITAIAEADRGDADEIVTVTLALAGD